MITAKSNNKFTVITIEKYSDYQADKRKFEQQNNNKITTNEQQNNTNNNVKNVKNERNNNIYAKANKRKYGEYQNVLLKDEELQLLKQEYSNWEELIKYLDEYIEMKGYKAKSHYLCIKRWVVDAVKRNQPKKQEMDWDEWVKKDG